MAARSHKAGFFGYFIGLIWSIFVLRMMFRKKYSDFRLAPIPTTPADDYPDARMPSFR
jgi:hypothetical protein